MKQLLEVTVEITTLVYADPDEAESVVMDNISDIIVQDSMTTAEPATYFSPSWKGCIPWGETGDRTIEEIAKGESLNIDWNTYAQTFPKRYLAAGPFDEICAKALTTPTKRPPKVLEIGGGRYGSPSLKCKRPGTQVWSLDPHVSRTPWAIENLDWDTCAGYKFDIIIARGSLNYLKPEQLEDIPMMLVVGGQFLANTFASLKEKGSREVLSTGGRKFLETYRLVAPTKEQREKAPEHVFFPDVVQHRLEPLEDDGQAIEHAFFYYTKEDLTRYLGECTFEAYGKNSMCVRLRRPLQDSMTTVFRLAYGGKSGSRESEDD